MKVRKISYLPEELAWLEANCTRSRAELHQAFCFRFGRKDVTVDNIKALCSRNGWKSGQDGRFSKGQVSHNKGRKMPYNPNIAATQFKAGAPPANIRPMGSERIGKDGYIEIKVPAANPYTGHSTRFIHKHRWNWEQVHGPLPKGMALKCLDGDRTNTDAANWQAIPRGLLPRLSGRWRVAYDTAEAEVKPALLALAKLEHATKAARPDRKVKA